MQQQEIHQLSRIAIFKLMNVQLLENEPGLFNCPIDN